MGVPIPIIIGVFPAVSSYFLVPTSTAMVACVAIDTTKTIKIGKWVFNHSYIRPGAVQMVVAIVVALALGSVIF